MTDKFSSLNLKARFTINNISKLLEKNNKTGNIDSAYNSCNEFFDIGESISERKFNSVNKYICEGSKIQLPEIRNYYKKN